VRLYVGGRRMSTARIARDVGAKPGAVYGALTGRTMPSLDRAAALAKACGITLDELWEHVLRAREARNAKERLQELLAP